MVYEGSKNLKERKLIHGTMTKCQVGISSFSDCKNLFDHDLKTFVMMGNGDFVQLQCKVRKDVNDIDVKVYNGREGHSLTNWVVKVELESAKGSSLCGMDG